MSTHYQKQNVEKFIRVTTLGGGGGGGYFCLNQKNNG
jgi:hypothetical protein